jgi:hypothetical protein
MICENREAEQRGPGRIEMQAGPQLAPCFQREVRERGFDYFLRRLVRITSGGAAELEAEVRGTEQYQVILRRAGDAIESYCGCMYFLDRRRPCKHLWAAVLAGDAAGHLQNLVPPGGVRTLDVDSILLEFEDELRLEKRVGAEPITVARAHLRPAPPPVPAWRKALDPLFVEPTPRFESRYVLRNHWPVGAELLYILNRPGSANSDDLSLALYVREPRKAGGWKKPQMLRMSRCQIVELPLVEDREIVAQLAGTPPAYYSDLHEITNQLRLAQPLAQMLVPRILATGRSYLFDNVNEITGAPLQWDDGPAWELVAELRDQSESQFALEACLRREGERLDLARVQHMYSSGFLLTHEGLAMVAPGTSQRWFSALKNNREIVVPQEQLPAFIERMMSSTDAPRLELPPSLGFECITEPPRPQLHIKRESRPSNVEWLRADLIFDYAGRALAEHEQAKGFLDTSARRWLHRDFASENEARQLLVSLGLVLMDARWQEARQWCFDGAALPRVAAELLARGWRVTVEGKSFRTPVATRSEVASGVDWFDLKGEVDYGVSEVAQLPELLSALHRGERMIELGDGSYGLLPEEWLRQFATIGTMGRADKDTIRFSQAQAGLLDALLAAQPEIDCDALFTHIRDGLRRFERVEPAEQPEGFKGKLRGYQREGLGWLQFLQSFGFGGCLADDMGVGKTAQVLALLETRRALRAKGKLKKPSIAIVPKSLVFNWRQEVERFTPQLRVVDHTGLGRDVSQIADCDLVLTTYGTLRRDIALLEKIAFDYVILDEAQAIKNAQTDSAKSVRLLRGDHRLAMSGTPIENHIGELWSLFEFLNPGLLGAASLFKAATTNGRTLDNATLSLIKRGVRPFILRRTKEEVACDLPPKTEQTLYCELEPRERKLYNQLRQHYRDALLPQIGKQGLAKTRIQVLEALLRLRQAACHPGLIDAKQRVKSSAKLDMLFEQLADVLAEGHKALIFSQFTSLLDLVRQRLDAKMIPHAYLDGKTRDRAAVVERFQTVPEMQLFLISLKAGGVGLNLTAADYVFILDPWWNPAAEAQAIDRTHRIGQQRHVFAYRLITRDTVEEKVLELQKTKRELADAILGSSTSLVQDLGREEIELLLS